MGISFLLVPLIFLPLGILFAIFPNQSGLIFCRLGKATWRISTFGLTDMHWFYREDKVPRSMRRIGIGFILMGVLFTTLIIFSFCGPNSLAAMREAGDFLKTSYGPSSGGCSLSCKSLPDGSNDVVVHYKYAGRKGDLHGVWNGKHYLFTELLQLPGNAGKSIAPP